MSEELKPCPFCGGTAFVGETIMQDEPSESQIWGGSSRYYIMCSNCHIATDAFHAMEKAIKSWIRRLDE